MATKTLMKWMVLLCSLRNRHHTLQRNRIGTWIEMPCISLRKDWKNQKSILILRNVKHGGWHHRWMVVSGRPSINMLWFSKKLLLELVYWLAKEDVKYASLMKLCINLGAEYLRELNIGRNATYTSEQIIIGVLLECIVAVIVEEI